MKVERPASAKTDGTEEEPAPGKLGKLSSTLIFLLVMSQNGREKNTAGEQVERRIKKRQEHCEQ